MCVYCAIPQNQSPPGSRSSTVKVAAVTRSGQRAQSFHARLSRATGPHSKASNLASLSLPTTRCLQPRGCGRMRIQRRNAFPTLRQVLRAPSSVTDRLPGRSRSRSRHPMVQQGERNGSHALLRLQMTLRESAAAKSPTAAAIAGRGFGRSS